MHEGRLRCLKPKRVTLRYAVRIQIVQKSQRQRRMCARIGTHTHTLTNTVIYTGLRTLDTHTQIHILFYYSCAFFYFTLLNFTSSCFCCFFFDFFSAYFSLHFSQHCCYFSHKTKATPAQDQRLLCEPNVLALSQHRHRHSIVLSNDLCGGAAAAPTAVAVIMRLPPPQHPFQFSAATAPAPPCATPTRRALSVAYFAGRCNCFANFKYRA